MLTERIREGYLAGAAAWDARPELARLARGTCPDGGWSVALTYRL